LRRVRALEATPLSLSLGAFPGSAIRPRWSGLCALRRAPRPQRWCTALAAATCKRRCGRINAGTWPAVPDRGTLNQRRRGPGTHGAGCRRCGAPLPARLLIPNARIRRPFRDPRTARPTPAPQSLLPPREPVLEFDRSERPFRLAVLTHPIEHEDGRAGLCIEIDRDALARISVAHEFAPDANWVFTIGLITDPGAHGPIVASRRPGARVRLPPVGA
jgi:hypothetical protein